MLTIFQAHECCPHRSAVAFASALVRRRTNAVSARNDPVSGIPMLVGFGLAADPTPEASWSCCPCAPFSPCGPRVRKYDDVDAAYLTDGLTPEQQDGDVEDR